MMEKFAFYSGVQPVFRVQTDKFISVKSGSSKGRQMLFCFFPDKESVCKLRLERDFTGTFTDILSDRKINVINGKAEFCPSCRNIAVLVEDVPEKS